MATDNNSVMKFFPLSKMATPGSVANLVISILLYLVAGVVFGFVGGLLLGILVAILPFLAIVSVIFWIFDLYCLIGIILAILYYCKKV